MYSGLMKDRGTIHENPDGDSLDESQTGINPGPTQEHCRYFPSQLLLILACHVSEKLIDL